MGEALNTHAGTTDSWRAVWNISMKGCLCSVRRTTGLERLIWSGSCTPRSLLNKLWISPASPPSLTSTCDNIPSKTVSSAFDGYPIEFSPYRWILGKKTHTLGIYGWASSLQHGEWHAYGLHEGSGRLVHSRECWRHTDHEMQSVVGVEMTLDHRRMNCCDGTSLLVWVVSPHSLLYLTQYQSIAPKPSWQWVR